MLNLKNALLDGQITFERGVDTHRARVLVPRNQSCLLINQTAREDFLNSRPGWTQIKLTYSGSTAEADQAGLEDGYFQCMAGYRPDSGPAHLVFSVSGKLYRVNALAGGTVQEITVPNARPTNRQQVWMQQAELFLIIQDGQSKPIIYSGAAGRESDVSGSSGVDADGKPLLEVPVGTCMAYSAGRLWVALPDGRSFVAGDGVYGPTGTAAFDSRDSVLRFTENQYLSEGFPFAVPANMGPIRAMVPVANLDTSLGQGPLQVFTPSGCFSVNAPFDRDLWKVMSNPIQTVSLLDLGALSPVGVALVNGDCWYRSLDGVRSFLIARRDFGTWGNRPMSSEVERHLHNDDWSLLNHSSMALYNNYLLTTCSPQRDPTHGIFHRGLVALDFQPLASMQGNAPPNWDGLWTGLDILQIATVESQGVRYCFAAVLGQPDDDGERHIELWQLNRDTSRDLASDGTQLRIYRVNEGPDLDFKNRGEMKLLEGCEIWASNVSGTVDFALYYRPDNYPCWLLWREWQVCAKTERCAADAVAGCVTGLNLNPLYHSRMSGTRPPDYFIEALTQTARTGYTFQYRLETIGACQIDMIRLLATQIAETTFGTGFPATADCQEIVCCNKSDFALPPGRVIPPPSTAMVGIVTEPQDVWIGTEDGSVIRTEAQPQTGVYPSPSVPPSPPLPPPPLPMVNLPVWPIPDAPYDCATQTYYPEMSVEDPITHEWLPVGIPATDPDAYFAQWGQPGSFQAYAAAVWSQFVAAQIPYTQARLVWHEIYTTGFGFSAVEVYPINPGAGNYHHTVLLNLKIVVEYCAA